MLINDKKYGERLSFSKFFDQRKLLVLYKMQNKLQAVGVLTKVAIQ